jgi:8-oxo-dGTP pyrophosphatase MutT (NUDIX family)
VRFSELLSRFMLSSSLQSDVLPLTQLRRSAVLVPLVDINDQAHVLLCKRPISLRHHPGQLCFPGGKVDPEDISLTHTALRECKEELDIPVESVTILGQLGDINTATGFSITPFLARLDWPLTLAPNETEVQSTLLIPLEKLIEPSNWSHVTVPLRNRTITLKGQMTEEGLLWGATANIIQNLIKQIS